MKINKIDFPSSNEPLSNELQDEDFQCLSLGRSPESRALARNKDSLKQELMSLSKIGDDSSEFRRPIHQEEEFG